MTGLNAPGAEAAGTPQARRFAARKAHSATADGAAVIPLRWLILAVVALTQLMVVLDATVMNVALPAAQAALHFSNADESWVVTAYILAFGSLLLCGGRLADVVGRKRLFVIGLAGFAVTSAMAGAANSFTMLVAARAGEGVFGALLAPTGLALLTTAFAQSSDRGKAFGVFGAITGAAGSLGLLLSGVLTSYLSWRWCSYVNVVLAAAALLGSLAITDQHEAVRRRLDVPGTVMVCSGMSCLVYGFSNATSHGWATPSTYGVLIGGAVVLAVFGWWLSRSPAPLLPPRVMLDRYRAAAYLGILIVGIAMFGIFLLVPFYLQGTLGYSPVRTGVAFLPVVAAITVASNVATIALMPRWGPRPLAAGGLVLAVGAMAWLTTASPHSSYAGTILGPMILGGIGLGLAFSMSYNAGTYGVDRADAGIASAAVNLGPPLGASIGTALLTTIASGATAGYLAAHAVGRPSPALTQLALVHGYQVAWWWCAAIFAVGALVFAALMGRGPLPPAGAPRQQTRQAEQA